MYLLAMARSHNKIGYARYHNILIALFNFPFNSLFIHFN